MKIDEAKQEYDLLTKAELKELNFTGEWDLDKRRFTKEYEKNLEIFSITNLEDLLDTEENFYD